LGGDEAESAKACCGRTIVELIRRSMAEGSEGWSREDELDLGQEDDPRQPDHGALDQSRCPVRMPRRRGFWVTEIIPSRCLLGIVFLRIVYRPETPPPRHADWTATGSVDGTGSNPDDSPSLHVSGRLGLTRGDPRSARGLLLKEDGTEPCN
jgi:hypothetical protein